MDNTNFSSDDDFPEKDIEFIRRLTKTKKIDMERKSIEMKAKVQETVKRDSSPFVFFNPFKIIASRDKIRFQEEGFDLDLSYITDKIIALAFPFSFSFTGNSVEEVKLFFEARHSNNYKMYNLCKEETYGEDTFFRQGYFPMADHETADMKQIIAFCQDAKDFLEEKNEHVIGVHCKAGKGRTGLLICCLLMYIEFVTNSQDAMRYFGLMRTAKGRSVKIPSQIRYINYFETLLRQNKLTDFEPRKVTLKKIKLYGIPNFAIFGGCTPYFKMKNEELEFSYKEVNALKSFKNEGVVEFFDINLKLQGDCRFAFFHKTTIYKDKMFKFWLNTFFIPASGVVRIEKSMLDWAFEDKNNNYFKSDFFLEITFMG